MLFETGFDYICISVIIEILRFIFQVSIACCICHINPPAPLPPLVTTGPEESQKCA